MTAIAKAARVEMTDLALIPVHDVLCRALGVSDVFHVIQWNDKPGQTAENVAAGLEFAALIFEQEHSALAAPPAEESELTCNRS